MILDGVVNAPRGNKKWTIISSQYHCPHLKSSQTLLVKIWKDAHSLQQKLKLMICNPLKNNNLFVKNQESLPFITITIIIPNTRNNIFGIYFTKRTLWASTIIAGDQRSPQS